MSCNFFVFVVAIIFQSHVQSRTTRCHQGDFSIDGFCIMLVDEGMIWSDANRTCTRMGYDLFWVKDNAEYINIDQLARSSWTNYWTGLHRSYGADDTNVARWTNNEDQEFLLQTVIWENSKPNFSTGKCVFAKKDGHFSFGNCLRRLPFICKIHASLEGYFQCRNGKGIKNEYICDNHNDCEDFSDELNCGINTAQCSEVVDAKTVNSGSISSSGVYSNSKSCYWTIVAGVGQTIKVTVKSFQTEKNADILQFRTGGMGGDIYLGELTGTSVKTLPTYYSSDNVFLLRLITDNTIEAAGFIIEWTTNVPEIFTNVKMLIADSSIKELKSPFYDNGYLPHEKVFEWVISGGTNNIVTLQINLSIGSSHLYLWDSEEMTLYPTLNGVRELKSSIFISKSKSVRLMLRSEGGGIATFNKGLYIRYWEGCKVNHELNEGFIQSPGYQTGSYPENISCQWTIKRPQEEARPISLRFNSFALQSTSDYVQIFNDSESSSVPSSPLHSGRGFTGIDDLTSMVVKSRTGRIWVKFETNDVYADRGFEAEFSVDCTAFEVSSQTNINSNEMYKTSFGSVIILTCDTGYSFKQEEFSKMSSVTIKCEKGGEWNVSRIPECMISYCPIPPSVDNGYISVSSGVLYGANVTYECFDGFTLIGNAVIECLANGGWSDRPSCQSEKCPVLPDLANGKINKLAGDGNEYGSVVQFTCSEGYEVVGNLTIFCMTGGKWSHGSTVCEKKWCPLPMIKNGYLETSDDLRFNMTTTLSCESGYGIDGTETTMTTVSCGADGLLDVHPCMDIDECEKSPPVCQATMTCVNRIGSYTCICKKGYERTSEHSDCTDINECNLEPRLCSQGCINTIPGYTCSCSPGYLLYTWDGFNNISLADGETGLLQSDVYRINHTCVRRTCPPPLEIPDGKALTNKRLIFYEDEVTYVCNHGFTTSDTTKVKCEMYGQYTTHFPTCSVATCVIPTGIEHAVKIYPVNIVWVNYGTEVNIECQYGSQKINITLHCSYNVITGQYEMMGDNPVCPEIDCGEPEVVPGSVYKDNTVNVFGSTFTFECGYGFDLIGKSLDGTTTVTCQENGRWNLGNLTCIGGRCSDPGTPGGAVQIVESYEVGKLLSFRCNNPGYYPNPPEPWECIVDDTGTVNWNTTDLPECKDLTPPVFSNCHTELIFIDKTDAYNYTVPTATDNSGSVKRIQNLSPGRGPGMISNFDIDVIYRAEDFSGNSAECVIKIRIKGDAQKLLTCPSYPNNRKAIYTNKGTTYNISEFIIVSPYRKSLKFIPKEIIDLDFIDIGNPQIAEVTVTDQQGGEEKCRFLIEPFAAACFKESFPNVQHGSESFTSGNVSCTLTCDTGYVLFDGNSSRTYDCKEENIWTPELPPQYGCIGYEEPAYLIEFMVVYSTAQSSSGVRQFAADCEIGIKQLLLNDLKSVLTSEIRGECNNAIVQAGDVEITDVQSNASSFDLLTTFTFKLLDTTITDAQKEACGDITTLSVTKLDFLDFAASVTCTNGLSQVQRKASSNNKVLSKGNSCTAGVLKLTDIGEKCVKCPPGTFSSGRDVCTECPDRLYQDLFGQTSCKTCPQETHEPSADSTACVALCPPGFTSMEGLSSCSPCRANYYWVNPTHCEACPNNGKTLGFDGVSSLSGCKITTKNALTCPLYPTNRRPIYTAEGIVYNVSDYITVSSERNTTIVAFNPSESITLDYRDVETPQIVEVTATDEWGRQEKCRIHLETFAAACFKESFPNVQHGSESCTSGNVSCTLTCDTGYILFDGNFSKTYDCEGDNIWTPAKPSQYACIEYEEPAYLIEFMVVYSTVQSSSGRRFAAFCYEGMKQLLLNDLRSVLTSEIRGACNNAIVQAGDVEITDIQSSPSSFDLLTTFTFKLLNSKISDGQKEGCGSIIPLSVIKLDFLDFTASVTCTNGFSQIRRKASSNNKVLSKGNGCTAGVLKLTDIGEKCTVKCPPGTLSSGGDVCRECPDGEFQDLFGMTECKTCPQDTPVPSADKTMCLAVCPPGFISQDGLPSCQPCPEDTYWFNQTYCKTCPDNGRTIGFDGVPDYSGCKLPCGEGEYSVTGYAPCKMCPVNYFQDQMAQGMCKECMKNQISQTIGSKSGGDCIHLGRTQTIQATVCCDVCKDNDTSCCKSKCNQSAESSSCNNRCSDRNNNTLSCQCNSGCIEKGNCCDDYRWICVDSFLDCNNPNVCNKKGICSYNGHGTVCYCKPGYVGERCETEVDPCSSSPCWNGGTCIKTGVDTYNCSCPVETTCKMVQEEGKGGNDADWSRDATQTKSQPNTEACEQFCLDSPRCLSVHYTEGYCFVYNKLTTTEDLTGSVYSLKQCTNTPLFGRDRCEDDLNNSCKNDTCSAYGMCQDLLGDKTKCLCPVIGVFTGDKCEKDTDLCNPDPCQHGTCVSYGSVRYQCVCQSGYSGENCDMNIDECSANPKGCLYNSTCVDKINSYECTCKSGFHGDRCKDITNFCSANPCPEGVCFSDYEKFDFSCKCEKPYRLANDGTCEMIPPCEGVECVNGTCGSDGRCDCTLGFEGSLCQHNIDDCNSKPCLHRGVCTDLINDYVCNCPPGYNGKNCDNNIDDCVGMCGDSNVERCEDLIDDYRCVCKPGYTGRNCADDINECWSYPCHHSGECTDLVNDYSCQCPQGWSGKQCEHPTYFCSSLPCQHEGVCYNISDGFFCRCKGGTKGTVCEDFPDVCNVIKPCTNNGQCKNVGGTAECSCSDNYDGSSCQLMNNQCGDDDICKNDGLCTTKDVGFECECLSSYSGSTCDIYTDPCSSNPCHNTAKCISEKHRHLCYCQNGGYLTDNGCKAVDENFDLYMDDKIGGSPGHLRTPFVLPPDSDLTVLFWFRVIGTSTTLLILEPVSLSHHLPYFGENQTIQILTNKVILQNFTNSITEEFVDDFADGYWHFLVFSWERNGKTRVTVDSISIVDTMTIPVNQNFIIMQVIFGSEDTRGRISQLRIYRTVFSNQDGNKAMLSLDHLQSQDGQLVQVWSNLAFSRSTFRKFPSQVLKDICDKGFPVCPDYNKSVTSTKTTGQTSFTASSISSSTWDNSQTASIPTTSTENNGVRTQSTPSRRDTTQTILGIGGGVGGVAIVAAVIMLTIYVLRRNRHQTEQARSYEEPLRADNITNRYEQISDLHGQSQCWSGIRPQINTDVSGYLILRRPESDSRPLEESHTNNHQAEESRSYEVPSQPNNHHNQPNTNETRYSDIEGPVYSTIDETDF